MRAAYPVASGTLTTQGFTIGYEVYGPADGPPMLLLPTWQIVHSRHWKMQIPYLARHCRVIVYDSPGNGLAERTTNPHAFNYDRIVDQGIDLLNHLAIHTVDVLAFSRGCHYGTIMAARYPERVKRLVLIGNTVDAEVRFTQNPNYVIRRDQYHGWERLNWHYLREHYPEWLDFFFTAFFPEPHSTKPIEDGIAWGSETTGEILAETTASLHASMIPRMPMAEVLERIQCPVLIIHGENDQIVPLQKSENLAQVRPDFEFVVLKGSGHGPHLRDPVKVNQLLGEFLGIRSPHPRNWPRAYGRPKRVLFISSPIGLGHIQRDLAIARELRRLIPGLEVTWWAQHPVTRVLETAGETIHPLSAMMASESAHWESETRDHDLHAFYAFRRMDEIFLANFMHFLEAVRHDPYDLWIGDESWELDYYLHENPECKTAPYVFLTDVIGFLPVDPNDPREADLCADYNAEMIAQRARHSHVRDLSLYVGEYDDLPDAAFGPDLPRIRDWAQKWFEPVGYVLPFNPTDYQDPAALRTRLGYGVEGPLFIAAVGGTAVGKSLLYRIADAFPLIRRALPHAQMVMVTGPRLQSEPFPEHPGLHRATYVHNLFEHLACADAAIVQGGLSTTMELVAARRPFVYVPLQRHWEQQHHVAFRLEAYRAGHRLDYPEATPERIADALIRSSQERVQYREVGSGGALRAANRIATLLHRG